MTGQPWENINSTSTTTDKIFDLDYGSNLQIYERLIYNFYRCAPQSRMDPH